MLWFQNGNLRIPYIPMDLGELDWAGYFNGTAHIAFANNMTSYFVQKTLGIIKVGGGQGVGGRGAGSAGGRGAKPRPARRAYASPKTSANSFGVATSQLFLFSRLELFFKGFF